MKNKLLYANWKTEVQMKKENWEASVKYIQVTHKLCDLQRLLSHARDLNSFHKGNTKTLVFIAYWSVHWYCEISHVLLIHTYFYIYMTMMTRSRFGVMSLFDQYSNMGNVNVAFFFLVLLGIYTPFWSFGKVWHLLQ